MCEQGAAPGLKLQQFTHSLCLCVQLSGGLRTTTSRMDLSDALDGWSNNSGQSGMQQQNSPWPGQPNNPTWPGQPGNNPTWPGGPGGQPAANPAWPGGQPTPNSTWPGGPGGQPAPNPTWPGGPGGQPAPNPTWPGGPAQGGSVWPGGNPSQPTWPSPQPSAPGGLPSPSPGPGVPAAPQQSLVVPFKQSLPNGLYDKMLITIAGNIKPNAEKFTLDLCSGNDVAFHFNPRFNEGGKQVVVRNSCVGGKWGREERELSSFPFARGQPFEMKILCTSTEFKVAVNNTHLLVFKHRNTNLRSINLLCIYYDLTLSNVQMETVA
ncbi:galectin-3b [Channa argus]|uniref:galectin-3b n=1 Tax=Channa argus TaxID=215402 RepID=UPI0029463E9E|nr:hypothetical protein Q8A73_017985 [Channa argus]